MKIEKDYTRDFELILLEITKRLLESTSVEEYYKSSKESILEYLNPGKSYKYTRNERKGTFKWGVEEENDPAFVISLTSVKNKYYVLDFYFVEVNSTGEPKQIFSKQGIEGIHYLDTLCKVLQDEILPILKKSEVPMLYFNAYNEDGNGDQRKAIFIKLISKYQLGSMFNIDVDGFEFKLYKK